MKKRIVTFIILIAVIVGGLFFNHPPMANAQALPFGGFVSWVLPCTCSASFWMMMVPFYSPVPMAGALVYMPGAAMVYANYVIPSPGVWLLGDYIPGVQACYIIIPYGCMVIPSMGVIRQVGTSAF